MGSSIVVAAAAARRPPHVGRDVLPRRRRVGARRRRARRVLPCVRARRGRASRLYVAGGLESKRKLQAPTARRRLRAACRRRFAGGRDDGAFVVLGGFEGAHERVVGGDGYDLRADAWATSTRLPTPRAWCRAASHAGRIVSIGDGVLGDGMMLEYCPTRRAQPGPPGGGATRSELASIFLG